MHISPIASISREPAEGGRRTRLEAETAEGLQPIQALRLYLESRGIGSKRQDQVIRRAEELVERDSSGPE